MTLEEARLTPAESDTLYRLVQAWDQFLTLPEKHPSDVAEFQLGIHQLQNLIAFRVARRVDPERWSQSLAEQST